LSANFYKKTLDASKLFLYPYYADVRRHKTCNARLDAILLLT